MTGNHLYHSLVIPFTDLFIILYYIIEEDLQLPIEAVDNEHYTELVV